MHRPALSAMRQIDCDALLKQDTPDALVLAILCDFKNLPTKDVAHYLVKRVSYNTNFAFVIVLLRRPRMR